MVMVLLLQNTEYKNGFSADHPVVQMFWKVFHEDLSLEDKRKFLRTQVLSINSRIMYTEQ